MAVDSEGDSEVAWLSTAQLRSSCGFPSAHLMICVRFIKLIVNICRVYTYCCLPERHCVWVDSRGGGGILIQTHNLT